MSLMKDKRQMMNIDDWILLESKRIKQWIILTK